MFTYNVKWYGNVDTTISGSGNLTPVSQQTMAVEQPVTVTAVNYAAGDNVEEGTVIATAEDAQGGLWHWALSPQRLLRDQNAGVLL